MTAAKPAWEAIAQARMIADNIHKDLADAASSFYTEREQKEKFLRDAVARIPALQDRIDRALKELAQHG